MNTNLCICRNEVYIEDEFVGQFEAFECTDSSRQLGSSAILTIPLYAIGEGTGGEARSRMRAVFKDTIIKPCARVEVYCWYDTQEKVRVFSGFIEQVSEGFPTRLYLADNAFILRFGTVQKQWQDTATLQTICNDCLPIAEEGFKAERERYGFTKPVPSISYASTGEKLVQAYTNALSFRNGIGRSPYETIQHLISVLALYGGVTDDFKLFVGAGVTGAATSEPISLDTRYNVVGRDIVPLDGRFIDFEVKITGLLKNGKQYTATGGLRKGNVKGKNPFGETFRGFSIMNTQEAIQEHADRQLEMLRRSRNKGSLSLVLYPKIKLFDQVRYTDTLFPELSGLYYVLDYAFKADINGYFQQLSVTDQIFVV